MIHIQIGSPQWQSALISATKRRGGDFWTRFTPVSTADLQKLETRIGRNLPNEFKEFYHSIGYGFFEPGDGFYSLEDIVACLGAPIYFVLGSLMPGKEWATKEQHVRLWMSRGVDNPNPSLFTQEALTLDGIRLYDLLQIGADGSACYHQLYIGPDPAPFRYCLLTDSGTIENIATSFSEALDIIVEQHLSIT